jgi:hypothetical protein
MVERMRLLMGDVMIIGVRLLKKIPPPDNSPNIPFKLVMIRRPAGGALWSCRPFRLGVRRAGSSVYVLAGFLWGRGAGGRGVKC